MRCFRLRLPDLKSEPSGPSAAAKGTWTPQFGIRVLCQLSEEFCHAAGSFVDVLPGDGIGNAYMLAGSEGLARYGNHVRFVKQPGGEFGGRLYRLAKKR